MINKLKIYFAGSIRGGRDDIDLYHSIINYLKTFGEVLTEHVGNKSITDGGELSLNDSQIHDRDMRWLDESDIMIAEVTNPSLGVGYEIGRFIEMNKKIICLYQKKSDKRLSAMIAGSNKLNLINYNNLEDLKEKLSGRLMKKPSH